MGYSEKADPNKLIIIDELIKIGKSKTAPIWEKGFHEIVLKFSPLKTSKSFWGEAQELQSNEQMLKDAITYLSSIAPPVICLSFKYFCITLMYIL